MSPNDPPKIAKVRGVDLSPSLSPAERVRAFFEYVCAKEGYNGFDIAMIRDDIKLLSASSGEVIFEFTVAEEHANPAGVLHVGAAALLFDICTATALIPDAREGFWDYLGVTRDLNITYLRPARVGTTLIITSTVVAAGKKLATIRGVAVNKEDGEIICTVEHLKFNSIPSAQKL